MKIFLLLICMVNGCKFIAQNLDKKIEIAMQDNFKNDKVSVKIENCNIFKNIYLTSDDGGFSGIIAEYYNPNKLQVTFYNGKRIVTETKCKIDITKDIFLYLRLNRKRTKFKFNLSNGKYIGLSKDKNESFEIRQQKLRFEYD